MPLNSFKAADDLLFFFNESFLKSNLFEQNYAA